MYFSSTSVGPAAAPMVVRITTPQLCTPVSDTRGVDRHRLDWLALFVQINCGGVDIGIKIFEITLE